MQAAETTQARAHFAASKDYSTSIFDIQADYLNAQQETARRISLELLDAAIAEMIELAQLEADEAEAIADAYAGIGGEADEEGNLPPVVYGDLTAVILGDSEGRYNVRKETAVNCRAETEAEIFRRRQDDANADYVAYLLSAIGLELTYYTAIAQADQAYYSAVSTAEATFAATVELAEKSFDDRYCQLTAGFQEALMIIDGGGTIEADFYENGAASLLVQVCFPAGFEVDLTDGSTKKIEDFGGGEEVWARPYDDPTGPLRKCKVVRTFKNSPRTTIRIRFDNGLEIQATPEHPFWISAKGWMSCEDLEIDDECVNKENVAAKVVSKELIDEKVPVFNIEVEGAHTYYIGKDGKSVLVHNECRVHDYAIFPDWIDKFLNADRNGINAWLTGTKIECTCDLTTKTKAPGTQSYSYYALASHSPGALSLQNQIKGKEMLAGYANDLADGLQEIQYQLANLPLVLYGGPIVSEAGESAVTIIRKVAPGLIRQMETIGAPTFYAIELFNTAAEILSKSNISWHQGTFGSAEESLAVHYEKHGAEVKAKSMQDYLEQADTMKKNIQGAKMETLENSIGIKVVRHVKDGKYIDILNDKYVVSFGKYTRKIL